MIVGLVTIFLIGNNYNFNEENFQVKLTKNNLQVTLVTPKNEEQVKGTIFFIHGDGAQNATQDGGYKPLMEGLLSEDMLLFLGINQVLENLVVIG